MIAIFRSALAVFAGAVVAFLLVAAVEFAGHKVVPPPAEVERVMNDPAAMRTLMGDREAMENLMSMVPVKSKVAVVVAWGLGAAGGAWVAAWVAGRLARTSFGPGIAVGVLLLLGAVANMLMVPHPPWMWVSGLAVIAAGAYLGASLGGRGAPREVALAGAEL